MANGPTLFSGWKINASQHLLGRDFGLSPVFTVIIRKNDMASSTGRIDAIAFLNMDQRILRYLRDKAKINQDENVQSTHQQIAYDLHTSRVVVSRLLKKLEIDGKISLQRNQIKVIDL